MTLVSSSIPNLVNGVSQQPDPIRLVGQCTLQENAYATVVKGLRKRPPSLHIAKLINSTGYDNAFTHTINRSAVEQYEVVVTNGMLQVFDLAGNAKTVYFPNGTSYLAASNPSQNFRALTVADYTFIVNQTVKAAMSTTLPVSPVLAKQALLYVKESNYGVNYGVSIVCGGTTYSANYTAPTGGSSSDSLHIDFAYICTQLINTLTAISGFSSKFTITQIGSVALIQNISSQDFTITTADGMGNRALFGLKDSLQHFTDLPQQAINGFWIKVLGDSSNQFDAYYVQYVDANNSSGSGAWTETTGQGIQCNFDATTMPWQLVRNGDGTFTFQPATWTPRKAGDLTSMPNPSFVGQTISDIFFHRDRLGLIAGENVIMSKAGQFFQFFQDTATDLLDSDPIDISAVHTKVSTLRAVAPYDQDLILFSDLSQFVLSGGDLLTPKTVTVKPVTEFENNSVQCVPIATGRNIYFTVARGSYTALKEFTTLPVSQLNDADDVTSHVPEYVPAGVFKMAASNTEGVVAMVNQTNRNQIHIYQYLWNGESKVQSAWGVWLYDSADIILNVDFINTKMIVCVERSDGVYLETIDLDLGRTDAPFLSQIHLDRRVALTGSYNATTNLTTWTLPYADTGTIQVVTGASFAVPWSQIASTSRPSSTTIAAPGDWSGGSCFVGRAYALRYRFTQNYVREFKYGSGYQAVVEGRLQLNRMSVTYEQSGYFRAEVTPYARQLFSYDFTGFVLGDAQAVLGSKPLPTGTFRFPVLSDAKTVQIDLVNDTHFPSSFQEAGWEGRYFIRSGRT